MRGNWDTAEPLVHAPNQQRQQQQQTIVEEQRHPLHSPTTPAWGIADRIVVSNRSNPSLIAVSLSLSFNLFTLSSFFTPPYSTLTLLLYPRFFIPCTTPFFISFIVSSLFRHRQNVVSLKLDGPRFFCSSQSYFQLCRLIYRRKNPQRTRTTIQACHLIITPATLPHPEAEDPLQRRTAVCRPEARLLKTRAPCNAARSITARKGCSRTAVHRSNITGITRWTTISRTRRWTSLPAR